MFENNVGGIQTFREHTVESGPMISEGDMYEGQVPVKDWTET